MVLKQTISINEFDDKNYQISPFDGIEEKAVKYYQNPDGSYECEVLVVIGNI